MRHTHYAATLWPASGGEMGWTVDLQAATDEDAIVAALSYATDHAAVLRSVERAPDSATPSRIYEAL